MIDYDKLRQAMDLAKKYEICMQIGLTTYSDGIQEASCHGFLFNKHFENIDGLLKIFGELNQPKPEPKFKIGETVWFIDCDENINNLLIYRIETEDDISYFDDNGYCVTEKDILYPSKEALIQAQIDYWSNLMPKDNSSLEAAHKEIMELELNPMPKCHHESDGRFHCISPTGNLSSSIPGSLPAGMKKVNKCKKCGEFYR